jgi:hypothetical protein
MGHSAEHQTKGARRLLMVGCATGIGAAPARLLAVDGMSEPEEVARHTGFLPSDDASFLTGQVFAADGEETLL